MPTRREIRTCTRCRHLKLRCDRTRPSCQRCTEATVSCSFRAVVFTSPTDEELSTPSAETSDGTITRSNIEEPPPPLPHYDANLHSGAPGEAGVANGPKVVRRRQRAHLSCTRCFRLKVKCDKELPCSRCRLSGWGNGCAYNHRLENNVLSSASHDQASVATEKDAGRSINSWHVQRRGATHWDQLLSHVGVSVRERDRLEGTERLIAVLA